MKRLKRETNNIPGGGYASILALFSCGYVSFPPAGLIALSTRRDAGIGLVNGGGGGCLLLSLISMDVKIEW